MNASKTLFDTVADDYDAWFDSPRGRAVFTAEKRCLERLIPQKRDQWLEVGVGSGRFASALGVPYGVDPSNQMLKKAEERDIDTRLGTAEDLPYGNNSMRGVLMVTTACFLSELEQALREIARVLISNGTLLIGTIPAESPWGEQYRRKAESGHRIYSRATFHTCNNILETTIKAGFTLQRASSTLLSPPDQPEIDDTILDGIRSDCGFVAMLFRVVE